MKNVLISSTDFGYMTHIMDHKIIPTYSTQFDDGISAFKAIKKMNLMGYLVKLITYMQYIMIKLFAELLDIFQGFLVEHYLHIFALFIQLFAPLLMELFTMLLVELFAELLDIFQVFLIEHFLHIFALLMQSFTLLLMQLFTAQI